MRRELPEHYIVRLVQLAKEIHDLQLLESKKQLTDRPEIIKTDSNVIRLNSKLNYLIGYIMALDEKNG